MRPIQEVGLEIHEKRPARLYFFVGEEIGIKENYLNLIGAHWRNRVNCAHVSDVVNLMKTKHIVPISPALYVVRYDEDFVASLDEKSAEHLTKLNIIGTLVCIYENPKHVAKIDKFFKNNTVSIDRVSPKFVVQYLKSDFPELSDRFIQIAVKYSTNYSQARNACTAMNACDSHYLCDMTDTEITNLFGFSKQSELDDIRQAVAARNFSGLVEMVDRFDGEVDSVLYTILSTMIELEKIINRKYSDSELQQYVKFWKMEDIYYMFMNTYSQLKKLRSLTISDPKNILMYLVSILPAHTIPAVEVLES